MATLTVWGITVLAPSRWGVIPDGHHNHQARVIVAAPSRAAAARAFQAAGVGSITSRYLATWGGETGNTDELATALAEPGAVFAAWDGETRPRTYVRVGP